MLYLRRYNGLEGIPGHLIRNVTLTNLQVTSIGGGSRELAAPFDITAGPDGSLWFVESDHRKIGRITPTGAISEFPDGRLCGSPHGIVMGPDGALWFTEPNTSTIGRITPAGSITWWFDFPGASVP